MEIPQLKVQWVCEKTVPYSKQVHIKSAISCVDILRELIDENEMMLREHCIVLFINRANRVIGFDNLSVGGSNAAIFDGKIIASAALGCMASGIILCHNHPSGNLTPSEADIKVTKSVSKMLMLFGINVLDHIILTTESYYSFANEGKL